MKRLILSLAWALPAFIYSSNTIPTSENEPSSLIEGCVSVVTGDAYLVEDDIVIQGAEPLRIRRSYISQKGEGSFFFFNHLIAEEVRGFAHIPEENGTVLHYKFHAEKQKKDHFLKSFLPLNLNEEGKGLTNTARGKISAQTNLKNQKVVYENGENDLVVLCADGTRRKYIPMHGQRRTDVGNGVKTFIVYKRMLASTQLPNGNYILYDWDGENQLRCMRTTDATKQITFSSATFHYHGRIHRNREGVKYFDNRNFEIHTSDGRKLIYGHAQESSDKTKTRWMLSRITSTHYPTEQLNYDLRINNKMIVTSMHLFEGRALYFDYYHIGNNNLGPFALNIGRDHPNLSRVKFLRAPVDKDSTPHTIYTFNYVPQNRVTGVIDIEGNITNYYWDPDYRLTIKDRLLGQQLYSRENFIWGTGADQGNLKCKTFQNSSGITLYATRYEYDNRGNITQEIFYGNLSGRGSSPTINPQGYPADNSSETYIKKYEYTNDGRNLLTKSEEQNGLVTTYEYLPGTNLLIKELTYCGSQIVKRKFYDYNQYRTLSSEIVDDGKSIDKNDLSGVHTRTIKMISPYADTAYVGMPKIIEEKYLQGSSEVLLRKTAIQYTSGGKVAQKEIYDAAGKLQYTLHYKYDGKLRLAEESNALGQIAKSEYDNLGNKTYYKDFNGLVKKMTYDCANRLIAEIEQSTDGKVHSTYHSYDLKSNRIKTIDYLGNETKYIYDKFGNLIETHSPTLKDFKGQASSPITRSTFDPLARETSRTNPNGHTTHTEYTAYNKPCLIQHPDKTTEKYIYNLDGTLKAYINTEGTETHYSYDSLKRPLSKRILKDQKTLSQETYSYQGMLLYSHTDPEGHTTIYQYDGASRKIAEEKAGERTEYAYDHLGRVSTIKTGELSKVKVYDLLDRVIEEREESANGSLLTKICTEYDEGGNPKLIRKYVHNTQTEESFLYDSFNRLIKTVDPRGQMTRYEYDEKNNHLTHITIDPLGLQTLEIYDPLENLIEKTQLNRSGETVSKESMSYDGNGNLLEQLSTIIQGNTKNYVTTKWEYDCRDRLIILSEAFDSPCQRTTRYSYTTQGLIENLYKPDSVVLAHIYDPLGRKVAEASSDQTIHHIFTYDGNSHLIEAQDLINKTHTKRTLDAFGRILSEVQGNGLKTASSYDTQGRKTQLVLPDHSKIEYTYDPRFLRSITRRSSQGSILYFNRFQAYDLAGNLLTESFNDSFSSTYTYDKTGMRKSIQSTVCNYNQAILELDPVGNVTRLSTQGQETRFTYNDLYQLTSERGAYSHAYLCDSHSSIVKKDGKSTPVDQLHQHTDLAYDNNGNPIKSSSATYRYDALGRLISFESSTHLATYSYDPLNRRLSKKLYTKNSNGSRSLTSEENYLYENQNEIGQYSSQGECKQLRILGRSQRNESGSAIALELDHQIYVPVHDLFGNVTIVAAPDGKPVEQTLYSAYGEEIVQSSLSNPWRFASKRKDEESNLVLFGRRYYDPSRGRWLTPDPAGFADSMNLYVFVQNNPFIHIDLYGYLAEQLAWTPRWKPIISAPTVVADPKQGGEISTPITHGLGNFAIGMGELATKAGFVVASPYLAFKNNFRWSGIVNEWRATESTYNSFYGSWDKAMQTLIPADQRGGGYEFLRSTTEAAAGGYLLATGVLPIYSARSASLASRSFTLPPVQTVKEQQILFGQNSVSAYFSELGNFKRQPISEIVKGLKSGTIAPESLPIEIIVRNGQKITLNNRSLLALRRAGMEPKIIIDRTGIEFYENILKEHLKNNPSCHLQTVV